MESEKIMNNVDQVQQAYPLAPPHTYIRSDEESIMMQEQRRKKRRKRMICIAALAVLQVIVILVFALVVMRFKTPRFRLRAASFTTFQAGNSTNPTLNLVMNAQFTVRNRNYGRYKYESGTVLFAYRGLTIGQAFIDESRARARTTKKVNATAVLSSASLVGLDELDQLGRDIGAGVLSITSQAELEGKVRVLRVIKKKKNTRLNCTLDVEIATRSVRNLICL